MTTQKTVENITIKDLVKEALSLPNGWHEEVWVEHGKVNFSAPMTQNSWSCKGSMYGTDPNYIGNLNSMSWGEIEGFYQREDGKIELDNPYDGEEEGEYYAKVTLYSVEEAIAVLADYLDNDASEAAQLLNTIKER